MKSDTNSPLFYLNQENVSYKDTVVLKNVTLEINQGERVGLIGPSGAGKTTLLRMLYQKVSDQSAFVHQHYALVPQLSAFHNVYIGRLDRNSTLQNLINLVYPREKVRQEIIPILDSLGIEEKSFVRVSALSGGEKQRVAVARAIYRQKSILLADDPVASVDPHQAGAVLELINQVAETVVMSLHAVELALKYAERIIGLHNGEIQFDLSAEEVTPIMLKELYQKS